MKVQRAATCGVVALMPWVYLGVVRPWQLRWGTTPEEAHRDLPGDDLVKHPMFEATRAVTIAAPPDQVWPWIIQMGTGRGGFYSLDFVDNARRRSARSIRPGLQHLAVGDVIPTSRDGTGFSVAQLEPERLLVLHVPRAVVGPAQGAVVVTITLSESGTEGTRLLCRLRADLARSIASWLYGLLFESGDFVMTWFMLAGIKSRAERAEAMHAIKANAQAAGPAGRPAHPGAPPPPLRPGGRR